MGMLRIHYVSARSIPLALKQADSNFTDSLAYLSGPQHNK